MKLLADILAALIALPLFVYVFLLILGVASRLDPVSVSTATNWILVAEFVEIVLLRLAWKGKAA